jgi:hypothetical protein
MSGARERAYAVIKYEPYIRPPGSLRRDLEARESWREMWERCCEGDAKSKWKTEVRRSEGRKDLKVVDRDWLNWHPGRDDDGGVEGEEKGVSEGGDEKVGEDGESESEQREGDASKDQSGDTPSSGKDGSSELHDFGRLEKYLTERFDHVFPKEALE